jgi:hypothetical protein
MSQGGPKLFRCVDVGDSASAMEATVLQNPLALQRLALFLFEETNAGKKRQVQRCKKVANRDFGVWHGATEKGP